MGIKDFFYLAYYHIDYFVSDVFILYILSLWLWTGALQPNTFINLVNIHKWNRGNIAFVVWLIPFILYSYYPIYSAIRKQREIYISRMHHNVLIFLGFLEFYFLFLFHGGGLFHKGVMMFIGFMLTESTNTILAPYGMFGVLYYFLYPLCLIGIWIGSIEGYFSFYAEPLPKSTKNMHNTKAKSQVV